MSLHPTQGHPTDEPLLTYDEAGKRLGVSHRTVWTLVDTGQLTGVRFGRSVRIDPADLRAFIQRSKGSAPQQGGDR